jgi:hypothetical protein
LSSPNLVKKAVKAASVVLQGMPPMKSFVVTSWDEDLASPPSVVVVVLEVVEESVVEESVVEESVVEVSVVEVSVVEESEELLAESDITLILRRES